jgi:hypothetical protein
MSRACQPPIICGVPLTYELFRSRLPCWPTALKLKGLNLELEHFFVEAFLAPICLGGESMSSELTGEHSLQTSSDVSACIEPEPVASGYNCGGGCHRRPPLAFCLVSDAIERVNKQKRHSIANRSASGMISIVLCEDSGT